MFIIAGSSRCISASMDDLIPEELRSFLEGQAACQLVLPGKADDLGYRRVRVQSLQFVSITGQGRKNFVVVEAAGQFEMSRITRQ